MIPEDGDGALLDMRHHRIDHPSGVGPIPHIVAEKDILVGPAAAGMFKAGLEGLAIGVDVADQRYSHGFLWSRGSRNASLSLTAANRKSSPASKRSGDIACIDAHVSP